jgi:AAA+ ATPase superfamily predicted ATPase
MPETYNAIITAIAGGSSRLNEIATKADIETSQCSKMLSTLAGLGLVRKEYPITETKSRRSIYILDDWMYIFWYRFVQPELSRITAGYGGAACDELFAGQINNHTGRAFEECAKQYMWRSLGENKSPIAFKKIGRWWGSNPKEHREEEIDFIAFTGKSALFGECKWKNTPVGEDVLESLIRKSGLFPEFTDVQYILFSRTGFTESLKNKAAINGGTTLIGVEDMLGLFNGCP